MKKEISSLFESIIKKEGQVIDNIIKNEKILQLFSDKKKIDQDEINFLLINNGKKNIYYQIHGSVIKSMIREILLRKSNNKTEFDFFKHIFKEMNGKINLNFDSSSEEEIIDLMEELHFDYLNSEYVFENEKISRKKSKINLRDKGAVYTPKKITDQIVRDSIDSFIKKTNNSNPYILDFGSGTGRFYFSVLEKLEKIIKKKKEDIIFENIFAIDSDSIALAIIAIKSGMKCNNFSENFFEKISKRLICENMLHVEKSDTKGINYEKTFPQVFKNGGFDIIVSNPPYFILKGTGNKKGLTKFYEYQKEIIKEETEYFRKNNFYKNSIQGMLNYYRLSVECMLKISNSKGVLGIICPATLFGDISASKLREELLENNQVTYLEYFPEKSKLFEQIAQATTIFLLNKNKKTDQIELKNNLTNSAVKLDFKIISKIFTNLEIPFVSKKEWDILKKTSKISKISQIKELRNRRGELDLTILKNCITKKMTNYLLVRGIDVSEEHVNVGKEYVDIKKFLKSKSEEYQKNDFDRVRIVGQQIANIDAKKRLKFAKTEPNYILGNSCNYITVKEPLDVDWILSQLNSYLLNWRFKITSSNNHVNNYEIDDLPIIEKKPKKFRKELTNIQKNLLVCNSFGLDREETKIILDNHFKEIEINSNYKEMFN